MYKNPAVLSGGIYAVINFMEACMHILSLQPTNNRRRPHFIQIQIHSDFDATTYHQECLPTGSAFRPDPKYDLTLSRNNEFLLALPCSVHSVTVHSLLTSMPAVIRVIMLM